MSRQPSEYREIHAAADYYEPRMAARARRAAERVRSSVTINDLAMALAAGSVRRVVALLERDSVREQFEPLATMSREAFVRGGRLGAEHASEAVE